jgi:hypothetical protein
MDCKQAVKSLRNLLVSYFSFIFSAASMVACVPVKYKMKPFVPITAIRKPFSKRQYFAKSSQRIYYHIALLIFLHFCVLSCLSAGAITRLFSSVNMGYLSAMAIDVYVVRFKIAVQVVHITKGMV